MNGGISMRRSIWASPKKKKKSEFQIALWAELTAQKEWCLKKGVFIDEDIKNMTEMLPKHGSVFTEHWFYTPDCCQLAADTFLHPIHIHTFSGAMLLCLPLASVSYYKNNPIASHLQASHIILIKYRQRSHILHPPIYLIYENVCKWYVPPQSVAFLGLIVAVMNPFNIQMHRPWKKSHFFEPHFFCERDGHTNFKLNMDSEVLFTYRLIPRKPNILGPLAIFDITPIGGILGASWSIRACIQHKSTCFWVSGDRYALYRVAC
jgi:hypothetical protein